MSIVHSILFKMMMKSKAVYVSGEMPDYKQRREQEEISSGKVPIPKGVQIENDYLNGVQTEFVSCNKNPKDSIIFYIHGGGFVTGSAKARRMFTTYMAKKMGHNVAAIDYRLAPENSYPAAPDDCFKAYKALIEKYDPKKIIILGESAGGNLVFSTMLQAKDNEIALPAGIFAIAPTVQYDRELPSYSENKDTDCIVANLSEEVCDVYFKSSDMEVIKNPYAAPIYGDYKGMPPVYLFASKSEVLRDDSIMMYNKLKKDGVKTELFLRGKMMHTYMMIPYFPESKKDLKILNRYINEVIEKR